MDSTELRQLKRQFLHKADQRRVVHNLSDYDLIKRVHPSLAKHILMRNDIVKQFAYQYQGCIDVMEQPMCNHCEKPALWHDGGTGYCEICGTITKNPLTFREFFMRELKGKSEQDMALILAKWGGDSYEDSIPTGQDLIPRQIILP